MGLNRCSDRPNLATIHRLQARTSAGLGRIATICRVFNGDWNTGRDVPDALATGC